MPRFKQNKKFVDPRYFLDEKQIIEEEVKALKEVAPIRRRVVELTAKKPECKSGDIWVPSLKSCVSAKGHYITVLKAAGVVFKTRPPAGVPNKFVLPNIPGKTDPPGGNVFVYRDTVPLAKIPGRIEDKTTVWPKGGDSEGYTGKPHYVYGNGQLRFAIDAANPRDVFVLHKPRSYEGGPNPVPWWILYQHALGFGADAVDKEPEHRTARWMQASGYDLGERIAAAYQKAKRPALPTKPAVPKKSYPQGVRSKRRQEVPLEENATRPRDAADWYKSLQEARMGLKGLADAIKGAQPIGYFQAVGKDLSKTDPKFWPKTKAAVAKAKQAYDLIAAVEREYGDYLTSLEAKARGWE